MKAKVLKTFIDTKEKTTREVGEEFTLSKARFEEITDKLDGYIEEVSKKTAKKKTKKGE